MINFSKGTPFTGSASLTSGAPGPTAFTIIVSRNQSTPYVAGQSDRICITNIVASSNDTASPLVSITDAAPTATTLWKAYLSASGVAPYPIAVASFAPGVVMGFLATIPKASAPSVTTAKTVEIIINGVIVTGT